MGNLVDMYCENMHRHFGRYYAVWPIGSEIKLGDVGVLSGSGVFQHRSDLHRLGVAFDSVQDPVLESYEYNSGVSLEIKQTAAASVPAAALETTVELKFEKEAAIAFAATEARFEHISDQIQLGREIEERYGANSWDSDHVVVISRLVAETTIAFVAEQAGASVRLRGSGTVGAGSLASLSGKLTAEKVERIGLRSVATQGAVPLIALAGIRPKFFGRAEYGERSARTMTGGVADPSAILPPDAVTFRQLMYRND